MVVKVSDDNARRLVGETCWYEGAVLRTRQMIVVTASCANLAGLTSPSTVDDDTAVLVVDDCHPALSISVILNTDTLRSHQLRAGQSRHVLAIRAANVTSFVLRRFIALSTIMILRLDLQFVYLLFARWQHNIHMYIIELV